MAVDSRQTLFSENDDRRHLWRCHMFVDIKRETNEKYFLKKLPFLFAVNSKFIITEIWNYAEQNRLLKIRCCIQFTTNKNSVIITSSSKVKWHSVLTQHTMSPLRVIIWILVCSILSVHSIWYNNTVFIERLIFFLNLFSCSVQIGRNTAVSIH